MLERIIEIDDREENNSRIEVISKVLKQTYPGRYKWKFTFIMETNYTPNWINKEEKKTFSLMDLVGKEIKQIYPDMDVFQISSQRSLQFTNYDKKKGMLERRT